MVLEWKQFFLVDIYAIFPILIFFLNENLCITEKNVFKENYIYYLIKSREEGELIFGKYENHEILDLPKIKQIVIVNYIRKDPINYL